MAGMLLISFSSHSVCKFDDGGGEWDGDALLQITKLQYFAQDYIANKWPRQDSDKIQVHLTPKSKHFHNDNKVYLY